MPGKQVKIGHIEAIPEHSKIGPYGLQSIDIHTRVNIINSQRFRKSNRALIETFDRRGYRRAMDRSQSHPGKNQPQW